MDTQQLKLVAQRVRALLAESEHAVGHSQALDLVAALPGLRNWPEVQAFPARVAACTLDLESTGRLANRLKRKCGLELTPHELLGSLDPMATGGTAPYIWPGGPIPGIYITTHRDAITALLGVYEDATDGGLVYAEQAGNAWPASIDLGEYGLWSEGLDRVPSGTLIVVGPLVLSQDAWKDSQDRLKQAANLALSNGHRVAVLVETPSESTLHADLAVLLKPRDPDDDFHTALRGVVTVDGDLRAKVPFVPTPPRPRSARLNATADAIPLYVREPILEALRRHMRDGRPTGLLLFGTTELEGEHPGIELAIAALAMTDEAGPAARVMPRKRGTPSKDWLVPESIQQLPFLPSIEAAYAQGYRRILYPGGYSRSEEVLPFADDALLISWGYADSIAAAYMRALSPMPRIDDTAQALDRVIAILALTHVPTGRGLLTASDLYVDDGTRPASLRGFQEAYEFFEANRRVRWEEEMDHLLDSGAFTAEMLEAEFPNHRAIRQYLSKR